MSKGRQSRPLFFISAKDCPKSIAKFSLIWYDINIFNFKIGALTLCALVTGVFF